MSVGGYIIYHGEELADSFKILKVFDHQGEISQKNLEKARETLLTGYSNSQQPELVFKDLAQLQAYCINLCTELDWPGVTILSTLGYNAGLGKLVKAQEIWDVFKSYGQYLANPNSTKKNAGFVSRFFKDS